MRVHLSRQATRGDRPRRGSRALGLWLQCCRGTPFRPASLIPFSRRSSAALATARSTCSRTSFAYWATFVLGVVGLLAGLPPEVGAAPDAAPAPTTPAPVPVPRVQKAPTCDELAHDHDPGHVRKYDPSTATAAYARCCKQGVAVACRDLADLYRSGDANKRQQLDSLLDRACTLGHGNSCFQLGLLAERGTNDGAVRKDCSRAAALFRRGCELEEGVSCDSLAGLYQSGKGVKRDKRKARELRKRAEKLGYVGE